ncbi:MULTISPECIES: hypothetical protein [Variovorax]|jgi:hypothetical protein|uniref:hypothetical protein n=1 Tax=Variovorax sp. 3P27G3 TaxID=2502214 RepID=UPI0010F83E04|nr:hypothetical protein [Variovorax sp. 3P27G3]
MPNESHGHWLVVVGACSFLLLAFFSGAGQAAMAHALEARPVNAPAMGLEPVPKALDDRPCVACHIAPGPVMYGFGELREPLAKASWQAYAASFPGTPVAAEHEDRQLRVPVRIAFCRWLD